MGFGLSFISLGRDEDDEGQYLVVQNDARDVTIFVAPHLLK
jgi:hypothetical protein